MKIGRISQVELAMIGKLKQQSGVNHGQECVFGFWLT